MTGIHRRAAGLDGIRTRTVSLDGISIDKGGDGRTVSAYATVFDTPAEVVDQDGHYNEQISRTAFDRSLASRGLNVGVFYNHGLTLHGTPSERHSVPLGKPVEIKPDGRGLFTRTRYSKTPFADEILEGINDGSIRAQSFTGRMLRSTPSGRGPHRMRSGQLTTVTRNEVALIEYGPTPLPVYDGAAIVGVRSMTLSDSDEMLLGLILSNLADGDAALDPIVDALCKTDQALDQAQAVLAQILGVPNPDALDGDDSAQRSAYMARLGDLATRLDRAVAAGAGGTPDEGRTVTPAPPAMRAHEVRAHLISIGVHHR